jgi:hypothetical protein
MGARCSKASLVFMLLASASGMSSWYMSIEASGDYGFSNRAFSADNEIALGKDFNTPLNCFVEVRNRVGYEDTWSEELSLGDDRSDDPS